MHDDPYRTQRVSLLKCMYWPQPGSDSMTREIASEAWDARTVELDSGTKDPSAAWFDGMWAASFRLEKRVRQGY
jgi:hypothetical protein